jgi:hypothetical protein
MQKKKKLEPEIEASGTPVFASAMLFGLSIPNTIWLYHMVWADPCSEAFFRAYELSMTWISTVSALEGAAACGLGYIDYRTRVGNSEELIFAMRKKRLAFGKLSFIMAIVALILIDKPSKNSVAPLLVA